MWTPSRGLLGLLLAAVRGAVRGVERLARDMIIRDRRRELRQVAGALVGYRLEPRSQRNQLRLTEGRAEESDAHRNAEHVRRRHLHVRIASRRAETRAAEDEVIAEQQVRRPGRVVGGRYHRIEAEPFDRTIDAVVYEFLVGRK